MSSDLLDTFALWPDEAQAAALGIRTLCWQVSEAAEVGPLSESLKWGQPAWRPIAPRTGSTLRLDWRADDPDQLHLYVDCKTDLAARVTDRYPGAFNSDARRRLSLSVNAPLPADALRHLAFETFTYHRANPQRR